jgi:hypothetical protein
MEQLSDSKITEFQTELVTLHRHEMRLRSILSSFLTSPEERHDAALELETLLQETRGIEDKMEKSK